MPTKNSFSDARLLLAIDQYGDFTPAEKTLILEINDSVMSVDGTGEGWGGYGFEPMDYLDTTIHIFLKIKNFYYSTCPLPITK